MVMAVARLRTTINTTHKPTTLTTIYVNDTQPTIRNVQHNNDTHLVRRELKFWHRHVTRDQVCHVHPGGLVRQPNLGVLGVALVHHEEEAAAEPLHERRVFRLEPCQHVRLCNRSSVGVDRVF